MDILGERWTLLIVRDLLLGPWRYSDLMARLPGLTTNLLAERLKEMEANGLIRKYLQSSVGSPHVYELTELGKRLEPVILSLATFGAYLMTEGPREGDHADIGRALLGLKLRYRNPTRTGVVTFNFDSAGREDPVVSYQVKYAADYVDVRHGKPWLSDVEIDLSSKTMAAMLFRGESAKAFEKSGALTIRGDRDKWLAFLDDFGLTNAAMP